MSFLGHADVLACQYISRRWFDASRAALYRSVYVEGPPQATKLLHLLLAQPRRAPLIREINLYAPSTCYFCEPYKVWDNEGLYCNATLMHKASIAPLLFLLPNLRKVELPVTTRSSRLDILRALSRLKGCQSISLINPRRDPTTHEMRGDRQEDRSEASIITLPELSTHCLTLGSLTSLSLHNFVGPPSASFGPASIKAPITELSLTGLVRFRDADLSAFLAALSTPLQFFKLAGSAGFTPDLVIAEILLLKASLRWLYVDNISMDGQLQDPALNTYLAEMTALEGAYLGSDILNEQTLLARLPALERILLRHPCISPLWVAAALSLQLGKGPLSILVVAVDGDEEWDDAETAL